MRRRLAISKETLTELSVDDLAGVVGAAAAKWTEPCVADLRHFVNEDILDVAGAGPTTAICI